MDRKRTWYLTANDWPTCMVPKKYRNQVQPWNDLTMHICVK